MLQECMCSVLQEFVCVTIATKTVGAVAEKCKPSPSSDFSFSAEPSRVRETILLPRTSRAERAIDRAETEKG